MTEPEPTDTVSPILAMVALGFGMAALLAGAAGEWAGGAACGVVSIGLGISAFT